MSVALWIAGGLLLLATALPFLPSDEGFIRVWDFPRTQIAFLLVIVLIASIAVFGVRGWTLVWHGLLALALFYQLYRIYPYTPIHAVEAVATDTAHGGCDTATIRLFVANVRQSNRQSASLIHELATVDPDLVLLLETDAWWERQLEPLRERYPNVVAKPQDNTYGMFLLSRLPLIEPQVRFLLEEYVPSIKTGIRLASGTTIDFHGVHPKPPPRHDTERRDAELLIVGREIRSGSMPAIVAGDLNDVAWSDTTRLFQQISGLLDPRIGRGLYSTYNANWPLLRWPIDQVLFDNSFTLLEMRRLGYIGSDHFPLYAALCQRPDAAPRQPEPQPAAEDLRRAREQIQEGREDAQSPD